MALAGEGAVRALAHWQPARRGRADSPVQLALRLQHRRSDGAQVQQQHPKLLSDATFA